MGKNKFLRYATLSLSAFLLAACGKNDGPREFCVSVFDKNESVFIDKSKAIEKQEFQATIRIKDECKNQFYLPNNVQQIKVGGNTLSSEQYTFFGDSKEEKVLKINADLITDDVAIYVNSESVEPDPEKDYPVICYSQSLECNLHYVEKLKRLEAQVFLKDDYSFGDYRLPDPENISIWIGYDCYLGNDLPSFITYDSNTGIFTIEEGYTTDEIIFTGEAQKVAPGPVVTYNVSIGGSKSYFIHNGPVFVEEGHNYNADFEMVKEGYVFPENIEVYVGNKLLDPASGAYTWVNNDENHFGTKARLSINSNFINDNIEIYVYVEEDPDVPFSEKFLITTYDEDQQGYIVNGITHRNVSSITVPSTFNDGTHGVHDIIKIEKGAFLACKNVETITLPFIGDSYYPENYPTENENAQNLFGYIFGDDLADIEGCSKITQYYYYDYGGSTYSDPYIFNIPNKLKVVNVVNHYKEYYLPTGAFSCVDQLSTVNLTKSNVISLGYCAFENCYGLSDFEIPTSVRFISDFCFLNCNRLGSVYIPENVFYIGANAFYQYFVNPNEYTSLLILCYHNQATIRGRFNESWAATSEDGYVHSVVYNADSDYFVYDKYVAVLTYPGTEIIEPSGCALVYYDETCTDQTVYIPDTFDYPIGGGYVTQFPVTAIGNSAFCAHPYIQEVSIPATVKSIGKCAFKNCYQLEKINILSGATPSQLTEIGTAAFCNDYKLTTINTGDTKLTTIGNSAFEECTSLTSIGFPTTLTTLGDYCFYDCTALNTIVGFNKISSTNLNGAMIFSGCTNLITTKLPEGLTKIPYGMFSGCINLQNVTLPDHDSLAEIGDFAFTGADFKIFNFDLFSNLDKIGEYAFSECLNLERVTFPSSTGRDPNKSLLLGTNSFFGCPKLGLTSSSYRFELPNYITFQKVTIKGCTAKGDQDFDYYTDAFSDWDNNKTIYLVDEAMPTPAGEGTEKIGVCATFPYGSDTPKWEVTTTDSVNFQGRMLTDKQGRLYSTCGSGCYIKFKDTPSNYDIKEAL